MSTPLSDSAQESAQLGENIQKLEKEAAEIAFTSTRQVVNASISLIQSTWKNLFGKGDSSEIEIVLGDRKVYDSRHFRPLSAEVVERIEKAIALGESLDSDLTIKVKGKPVYKTIGGQVKLDSYNFSQQNIPSLGQLSAQTQNLVREVAQLRQENLRLQKELLTAYQQFEKLKSVPVVNPHVASWHQKNISNMLSGMAAWGRQLNNDREPTVRDRANQQANQQMVTAFKTVLADAPASRLEFTAPGIKYRSQDYVFQQLGDRLRIASVEGKTLWQAVLDRHGNLRHDSRNGFAADATQSDRANLAQLLQRFVKHRESLTSKAPNQARVAEDSRTSKRVR